MDIIRIKDIKEIMALFSESDINELNFESGEMKLHLVKAKTNSQEELNVTELPLVAQVSPAVEAENLGEEPEISADIHEVCAPMVGTFYRAPSPDSEPFVNEGSQVEPGQTLCIVEAMKLMNEIECEYNGRVLEILVENGQPVEYGQPLFLIKSE